MRKSSQAGQPNRLEQKIDATLEKAATSTTQAA
jgi:hypothetical protein